MNANVSVNLRKAHHELSAFESEFWVTNDVVAGVKPIGGAIPEHLLVRYYRLSLICRRLQLEVTAASGRLYVRTV